MLAKNIFPYFLMFCNKGQSLFPFYLCLCMAWPATYILDNINLCVVKNYPIVITSDNV